MQRITLSGPRATSTACHLRMTSISAQRTAGVDVKRTLLMAGGNVAIGGGERIFADPKEQLFCPNRKSRPTRVQGKLLGAATPSCA
jgi:hypothetical protein